jgi:hypothetical protein
MNEKDDDDDIMKKQEATMLLGAQKAGTETNQGRASTCMSVNIG